MVPISTCNLYKLCQLKINIKKLIGPNEEVHLYLSINEAKPKIHNYSLKKSIYYSYPMTSFKGLFGFL